MAQPKDLMEFIDYSCLECLNQNPSHTVANAIKQGYREDDGLLLESDEDAELLLNVHFNQKVSHSLGITSHSQHTQHQTMLQPPACLACIPMLSLHGPSSHIILSSACSHGACKAKIPVIRNDSQEG